MFFVEVGCPFLLIKSGMFSPTPTKYLHRVLLPTQIVLQTWGSIVHDMLSYQNDLFLFLLYVPLFSFFPNMKHL